ncbi:MAG: helix-turn-helix transcriptional regulator [Clostridiales bacterium]|nr:helix-turn-helix transcriptional regulator [Clostridiales bacterium]
MSVKQITQICVKIFIVIYGDKMNIGEELKYHRQKANLSQRELAKLIGISQQNISRWENNEVEPSISSLIVLADYYGITLDELIGRDTNNNG